jgi:hypothetical protein
MLPEQRAAISARWLDAVLADYGEQSASKLRKVRDPFANPVGHALAVGLPLLLDYAVEGGELPVEALGDIVRIRSVQEAQPSRALRFITLLREVTDEPAPNLEALLLRAFDLLVGFREQVLRLRQEELKRSVASVLRYWHGPQTDLVQLTAKGR